MTINDVVNQKIAGLNHGGFLQALSARQAEETALSNRLQLAKMASADETARALTLLNAREKFSAAEGEKNRKAQRENIEAQADAYTKRLTAADKQKELARLRALIGGELKGDMIDDQIADGLRRQAALDYPEARGAAKSYKDFEKRISKLDDDISSAEEEDSRYIKSTAASLARQQAAESLTRTLSDKELKAVGNIVSETSIRNATRIPQKRRTELLQALNDGAAAAQPQMEAMLFSDKLDRPTANKVKALRNEKLKAESEFSRFQSLPTGRLAASRIAVERDGQPMALDTQPDDREPAGVETAKAILGQLNSGATFQPVAGEVRQRDEQLMAGPSATAPAEATSTDPSAPYLGFRRGTTGVGKVLGGYGYQDPGAPDLLKSIGGSLPTAAGIRSGLDRMFAPIRNAGNAVGDFLNPTYGAPSEQERARLSQLFGPDAPDLIGEVAKLAEANGMDRNQQMQSYKAALSGDPSAGEKLKMMLDFVRQSKYSPDFMPVSTPEFTAP